MEPPPAQAIERSTLRKMMNKIKLSMNVARAVMTAQIAVWIICAVWTSVSTVEEFKDLSDVLVRNIILLV
ncbi:unnamed protein product [Ilex paraguariensis]|uniref:Uncharacterized protein n=1 Tax=Ilex paraguariensis TaxID=185542 RepID=A0ABC8UWJ8_9AQUA